LLSVERLGRGCESGEVISAVGAVAGIPMPLGLGSALGLVTFDLPTGWNLEGIGGGLNRGMSHGFFTYVPSSKNLKIGQFFNHS